MSGPPKIDPWRLELLVVAGGSHGSGERGALSRDAARGVLLRIRESVYVERTAFESLSAHARHIVVLRALCAVSSSPVLLSHWSAAVLHGLPILDRRLGTAHRTVGTAGERSATGVSGHVFAVTDDVETTSIRGLRTTAIERTVVDIAGAAGLEEGVMAATGALRMGVPRESLELAAALAGPRQAHRRIRDAIALAHPGAESAAESRSWVTMMRIGVEPPELQHRMVLTPGWVVFLDDYFERTRSGGEVDGDKKLLDPTIAPDVREAYLAEKRREDAMRAQLNGLARWGWVESGNVLALRSRLSRLGVVPGRHRATLSDYAAVARTARARFVPARSPV